MGEMASLRDTVADEMDAGHSLEEMEHVIEDSGLGEEEQSAVWLFAWSQRPGTAHRHKAAAAALAETYDGSTRQDNSARQLSDVMGAVREHEGQTKARRRPRGEDEQLYRRSKQALAH